MAEKITPKPICKDKYMWWPIGILLLVGLACFVVGKCALSDESPISIVGGICSILGFVLTFVQIARIRSSTDAATEAVSSNIEKINKYLSFSDVSKYSSKCDQILNAITTQQYGEAKIFLLNLQEALIEIQSNERLASLYDESTLTQLLQSITPDVKNLQSYLTSKTQIDFDIISLHVVKAKEFLLKVSGKLKYSEL